jgi:hypothetical protein
MTYIVPTHLQRSILTRYFPVHISEQVRGAVRIIGQSRTKAIRLIIQSVRSSISYLSRIEATVKYVSFDALESAGESEEEKGARREN